MDFEHTEDFGQDDCWQDEMVLNLEVVGDDTPSGGDGDNLLFVDDGADLLLGGFGFLRVGEGLDALRGGPGFNIFVFTSSNPEMFATIENFNVANDTLVFDVPGLGEDADGADFADGSGGLPGGAAETFFSGAAADAMGERVVVITDQGFATASAAVQAVGSEDAGDFVLYFNTTSNVLSLLVVSAPDTAASIARFTNFSSLEDLQNANFTAGDFLYF